MQVADQPQAAQQQPTPVELHSCMRWRPHLGGLAPIWLRCFQARFSFEANDLVHDLETIKYQYYASLFPHLDLLPDLYETPEEFQEAECTFAQLCAEANQELVKEGYHLNCAACHKCNPERILPVPPKGYATSVARRRLVCTRRGASDPLGRSLGVKRTRIVYRQPKD